MQINTPDKSREQPSSTIADALLGSCVDELNIYNQAYLELDRPLIKTSVKHKKTQFELPIAFNIDGDFSGSIICLLDSYDKKITNQEESSFKSLYIESMNILLGKMMTNLENHYEITALISEPKIPSNESIEKSFKSSFTTESLSMGYNLISNKNEFDCRIIFNINKKRYTEA
ncbi:MAG: chemotaxis protein CheY-P-specific phosphatase CheC [Bacteriovoracaceae bacterium]|jgi:chemotaxis protein CheY-P-specific phosphatase CheC